MQTIFYTFPRLSGVTEEEWIALEKFVNFTDIPSNVGSQWYLSGITLGELSPGDWSQQDQGKGAPFYPGSLVQAPDCCSRMCLIDFMSLTWFSASI